MATPHDKKPEIGDLIEIVRGAYQHWPVYVGDGFIVHLTSVPEVACTNSMRSVPNNKALVTKQELRYVVGTDEWKINNILDGKHEPHSKEDIVRKTVEVATKGTGMTLAMGSIAVAAASVFGAGTATESKPRRMPSNWSTNR